tara:strand:+ start:65 stop:1114 length:1050 start_codon:yes stop_codon:yes gene_type:complete
MSSKLPEIPQQKRSSILKSSFRRRWPFLIWAGMIALSVWLYQHGGDYMRINGMVEIVEETVSPLQTGRVTKIHVFAGEPVVSGQIVAEMDTTLIDQEMAALSEEIEKTRAEDERQLASAEQRLSAELREIELDWATDKAEARIYSTEIERLETLVERGLVTAAEVLREKSRYEALKERIKLYPSQIKEINIERNQFSNLRSRIFSEPSTSSLSTFKLLLQEKENLTLRANQAGIVSQIKSRPGDVIRAGDTVVRIVTERQTKILAFMNESDTRSADVGDIVQAHPAIGGERFDVKVTAVSPNILALPDRASPIPNHVVRGRRIELIPLEPVTLSPGASIIIILPQTRLW